MMRRIAACVLVAAGIGCALSASGAADIPENLRACAREADNTRRLACYDREVGAASAPTPAKAAVAPVVAASAAARASEAEFGAAGSEVARKREQQKQEDGTDLEEIAATVTKVQLESRGELVLTLDNGQTWRQKRAESYFPLAVGDKVRIRRGSLGSFRLTNPGGRITQVTRVE